MVKGFEYAADKFGAGINLSTNTFYMFYLSLTFFHFMHVIPGMVILVALWWKTRQGAYGPGNMNGIESGAAYWHMVDLVWIVLFPCLCDALMETPPGFRRPAGSTMMNIPPAQLRVGRADARDPRHLRHRRGRAQLGIVGPLAMAALLAISFVKGTAGGAGLHGPARVKFFWRGLLIGWLLLVSALIAVAYWIALP